MSGGIGVCMCSLSPPDPLCAHQLQTREVDQMHVISTVFFTLSGRLWEKGLISQRWAQVQREVWFFSPVETGICIFLCSPVSRCPESPFPGILKTWCYLPLLWLAIPLWVDIVSLQRLLSPSPAGSLLGLWSTAVFTVLFHFFSLLFFLCAFPLL